VAHESLDHADVITGFQQVRGEAVAEGVARDPFVQAGGFGRVGDGPAEHVFVYVPSGTLMATNLPSRLGMAQTQA